MSEELPAEELLARVARHDVAALNDLYDRFAPRVYGLMAHILPSRDVAEEVLQQVFLRLWSESPRLSHEGVSVAAWLVVTAREAAVCRLRTQRRSGPSGASLEPGDSAAKALGHGARKCQAASLRSSAATEPHPSENADPLAKNAVPCVWFPQPREIAMIDQRLPLLHKVINQLPQPQRQALELAVFGGLSESEIAVETGEPLGKVRTSLRAAVTFVRHRRQAVCGTWTANI